MKLPKRISTRAVVITASLMLLLMIGFYLYMLRDLRAFEASLPVPPAVDTSSSGMSTVSFTPEITSEPEEVISKPEEALIAEDSLQTGDIESEEVEQQDEAEVSAGTSSLCHSSSEDDHNHAHEHGASTAGGVKGSEPKLYGGLTPEQYDKLQEELVQTKVPDLDEKYALLEAALIDEWGPHPNIPKIIANAKILHAFDDMALTLDYSDSAAVDKYLSYEPIAVARESLELQAEVYGYPETLITTLNNVVEEKAKEVEKVKFLQDIRPIVQASIDAGELSTEEGEAFIQSQTGLKVTMHQRGSTSLVDDTTSPPKDFIAPKGAPVPDVDLNIPEIPGD